MIRWREGCTKQSWGTNGGTFTGGPHKIVLHSTETGTWPGYDNGANVPHETWKWNRSTKKFDKRQHVPHDVAARALRNGDDPAQTNRDSAHQVELIGSCDEAFAKKYGYDYLPGLGDDFLLELGREIRQLAADTGVVLEPTDWWRHYPDSYGESAAQRFSIAEWDGFAGICGHQHVPDSNSHGDPGDIDVPRALALSAPEEDMPLTDDDLVRIAKAVQNTPDTYGKTINQRLSSMGINVGETEQLVRQLVTKIDGAIVTLQEIKASPASSVDAKAIASELIKQLSA